MQLTHKKFAVQDYTVLIQNSAVRGGIWVEFKEILRIKEEKNIYI